MWLLFPLLDEFTSGLTTAGAPELDGRFASGSAVLAVVLFVAPQLAGMVFEPPLLAWSDRHRGRRHWFVAGGLAAMGLAFVVAAHATTVLGFALAYACYAPASGVALGVAQAVLVDDAVDPERALTRWTLFAELGDVLAPATLVVFTLSPSLFGAGIGLVGLGALVLVLGGAGSNGAVADARASDTPSLWTAAKEALRRRELLGWLFAVALCTFLDEILVVFGGLFLVEGFPEASIAALWVACTLGGVVGLLVVERTFVDASARARIAVPAMIAAAGLGLVFVAPSASTAALALFLVGAGAAPLYPHTLAAAHRALPGQPGMVGAVAALYAPIDLLAPIFLGVLADTAGAAAAVAVLLVQPIGILVVVALARAPR